MAAQGIIYTITDVISMNEWIVESFDGHPLYERLSEEELALDPLVELIYETTEEGQKVVSLVQLMRSVFSLEDTEGILKEVRFRRGSPK